MPSVRSRFVCAKLRSKCLKSCRFARAVAWWTIGLGLDFEHGLAHGACVEQIEHDRLRAERSNTFGVSRRPRGADHLVSSSDQLRNEPGADSTTCPRNENSHHVLLIVPAGIDVSGVILSTSRARPPVRLPHHRSVITMTNETRPM